MGFENHNKRFPKTIWLLPYNLHFRLFMACLLTLVTAILMQSLAFNLNYTLQWWLQSWIFNTLRLASELQHRLSTKAEQATHPHSSIAYFGLEIKCFNAPWNSSLCWFCQPNPVKTKAGTLWSCRTWLWTQTSPSLAAEAQVHSMTPPRSIPAHQTPEKESVGNLFCCRPMWCDVEKHSVCLCVWIGSRLLWCLRY